MVYTMADQKTPPPSQGLAQERLDTLAESMINLILLDPARWGWTAAGGVVDLLPPHERARRKSSKRDYLRSRRKRDRVEANSNLIKIALPKEDVAAVSCPKAVAVANGLNANVFSGVGEASVPIETNKSGNGTISASDVPMNPLNSLKPPPLSAPELQKPANLSDCTAVNGSSSKALEDLDLSVRKAPPSASTETKGKRERNTQSGIIDNKRKPGPIQFKALTADGTIDIYSYHRGREGMELRDEQTGELLCDVEATDTNYGVDEPKLVANVTIKFPLEDEGDSTESETGVHYYTENIKWDLGDPKTLTPMLFAADIAESFGISFNQTLDLAESIQAQLETFVEENCGRAIPLALTNTLGHTRDAPAPFVCDLYGEVTGSPEGGFCRPASQKPRAISRSPSVIATTTGGQKTKEKNTKGKAPRKDRRFTVNAKDVYREEVQKRLRAVSVIGVQQKCDESGKMAGEIEIETDCICHICNEERERCGIFACGSSSHAYCEKHLSSRVDLSLQTSTSLSLDFCPICSLVCTCSECSRILDLAARDFKKKAVDQGTTPDLTVFDGLFDHCRNPELKQRAYQATSVVNKSKAAPVKRRRSVERPRVPKVAVSELPREVCNGLDIAPGTIRDYCTVYTEKGAFVSPEAVEKASAGLMEAKPLLEKDATTVLEKDATTTLDKDAITVLEKDATTVLEKDATSPTAEDGSVDYCHMCRKCGNLLCCDFCPRAFHQGCVKAEDIQGPSDVPWECPSCRNEKAGVPEHEINGDKSLALVCSAFDKQRERITEEDSTNLRLLSIIHEMLLGLMEYDFGYMFADPVDCKQIPVYSTIVKTPMDLGAVASNIINGRYFEHLSDDQNSWDEVVLAVLKDIELVWHNCFHFNVEGSAVYRMAEVQRRRAQCVQKRSFQSYLSEKVNQEVEGYVQQCEKLRGMVARLDPKVANNTLEQPATKSRHKITVKPHSSKGRPVAVFDPDTGKVVKIYSTVTGAGSAVEFVLGLGHKCEWAKMHSETLTRLRKLVKDSRTDPDYLLFGYRWVFLDELKSSKVSFESLKPTPEPPDPSTQRKSPVPLAQRTDPSQLRQGPASKDSASGPLEMVDGEHAYVYCSVEESLSFPGLSTNITELRERLASLVPSDELVEIEGRKWRMLLPSRLKVLNTAEREKASLDASGETELANDHTRTSNKDGANSLLYAAVLKEDLLAGSKLVYFRSIKAAYQDWLQTCESSPVPNDEPKSLEVFQFSYLYGDRNVDGLVWRMVTGDSRTQVALKGDNIVGRNEIKKSGASVGLNGPNGIDKPNNSGENEFSHPAHNRGIDEDCHSTFQDEGNSDKGPASTKGTEAAQPDYTFVTATMQINSTRETLQNESSGGDGLFSTHGTEESFPESTLAIAAMQESSNTRETLQNRSSGGMGLATAQGMEESPPESTLATTDMQDNSTRETLQNGSSGGTGLATAQGTEEAPPDSEFATADTQEGTSSTQETLIANGLVLPLIGKKRKESTGSRNDDTAYPTLKKVFREQTVD